MDEPCDHETDEERRLRYVSNLTIIVTGALFIMAALEKGFTKGLLLEAAVFLISVKLVLTSHRILFSTHRLDHKLDRLVELVRTDSAPLESGRRGFEMTQKSFGQPDERRDFVSHGHIDLIDLGNGFTMGRAIFQPGWRWSSDVKPLAGTDTCKESHVGYCISGMLKVEMDNGDELTIKPGDAFNFGPGHDSWVIGQEPCVLIDVVGFANYAKKAQEKAA